MRRPSGVAMLISVTEVSPRPLVLIAGGGVAALEAVLALEALAGARVRMELLTPADEFVFRPLLVGEPFDRTEARHVALRELLAGRPVRHVQDGLAAVDAAARCVRTTSGADRGYDALLVASGARTAEAVPGALTFGGPTAVSEYRKLLADLDWARVKRVVFTLARGAGWSIPLYELALLTAAHLSDRGMSRHRLEIVTPEPTPLAAFGAQASRHVADLLERSDIAVRTGVAPRAATDGALLLADGGSVPADRVVALPRSVGPRIPGLPADAEGFVPVDEHGRVAGLEHVYAAGDVTAWPDKQGGLASQQADAAAETIAAWAGAPVQPAPFRPVLRGLLLTDDRPVFLRGQDVGSPEETSTATTSPLWWPSGKIAGRYLTAYLQARGGIAPPPGVRKLVAVIAARDRGPRG
jgi:sulfide:quinone oxidoreductase